MRTRSTAALVSLAVAGLGAAFLLLVGGLIAFIAGSGGLYGSGSLLDATPPELLLGFCILLAGCIPLAFVSLLAFFLWRRIAVPQWVTVIGWTATLCILAAICLDVISTSLTRHGLTRMGLAFLTLPSLPFTFGLLGFLVFSRGSKDP